MTVKIFMEAQLKYDKNRNQQSIVRRRLIRFLAFGGFAIVVLLLSVILNDVTYEYNTEWTITRFGSIPNLLNFMTWSVYLLLHIHTIITSTHTLSREHLSNTLESLILTNATTRDIIYGKWLAILKQQIYAYGYMAFMCASGILIINHAFNTELYQKSLQSVNLVAGTSSVTSYITFPSFFSLIIGLIINFIILFISFLLASACGIFGASFYQDETKAAMRGLATRILINVFPYITFFLIFGILGEIANFQYVVNSSGSAFATIITNFVTSAADFGNTALSSLAQIKYTLASSQTTTTLQEMPGWSNQLSTMLVLILVAFYYFSSIFVVLYFAQRNLTKIISDSR